MKLQYIWEIIKRKKRRWLLIFVPALVLYLIAGFRFIVEPEAEEDETFYSTTVSFMVGQRPDDIFTDEDRYSNWLASQFIAVMIFDWVNGSEFTNRLQNHINERGIYSVTDIALENGRSIQASRSSIFLSIANEDKEKVQIITEEAIDILMTETTGILPQAGNDPIELFQMDEIVISTVSPSVVRGRIWHFDQVIPRLPMAFVAGIFLFLLSWYFDPTVRARQDMNSLDLLILSEIPSR